LFDDTYFFGGEVVELVGELVDEAVGGMDLSLEAGFFIGGGGGGEFLMEVEDWSYY